MNSSSRFRFKPQGVVVMLVRFIVCGWVVLFAQGPAHAASDALADAVENQDSVTVRALMERKVNVNAPQADGTTALHWAAHHDDLGLVKSLLAAGADAKAANRYGVTPLSLACTNGNAEIVAALLKAGADPAAKLAGGEMPLMIASRTGRLGAVGALLAQKVDVNAHDSKGQTALMWAAAEGNLDVVDALLEAKADFRVRLPSGFTALFFAVRDGRQATALRLLKAGLDVNDAMSPDRGRGKPANPLILAVDNGHFELAAALLEAGADANARPAGYAALHAITWVRKPIRGDGDPPPIGSGKLSSLDLVRKLAEHHADINVRLERGESGRGKFTMTGSTPFLLAARTSDLPLMRLLIQLGADPKLPNVDHSTPLLAAAGVGALGDGDETAGTEDEALEAARLLLDLGANVNAVDDNGETAMHGAAYQDRPKLVKLFAERHADIKIWNHKNKWGWTPLLIAEGHRPGNFRPAPDSIAAINRLMPADAVAPAATEKPDDRRKDY
jgi:uncharacterized protein